MKLWKLSPRDDLPKKENPWIPWWDKTFGFVVRAETENVARRIAARECGDEGRIPWIDPKLSKCEEITQDGESGVIIQDLRST